MQNLVEEIITAKTIGTPKRKTEMKLYPLWVRTLRRTDGGKQEHERLRQHINCKQIEGQGEYQAALHIKKMNI